MIDRGRNRYNKEVPLRYQLMFSTTIGYIILCIFLGCYSWYSLISYSSQLKTANSRVADSYLEQITSLVDYSDNFLQSVYGSNLDFSNLIYNSSSVEKYLAEYNILKLFDVQLDYNKNLSTLFIVHNNGENMAYRTQTNIGWRTNEQLKLFIRTKVNEARGIDEWYVVPTDEKPYLLKILGGQGVYLAAVVDFSGIVSGLAEANPTVQAQPSWIFCADGHLIGDEALAWQLGITGDDIDAYNAMNNKIPNGYIFRCPVKGTTLVMYMILSNENSADLQMSQIIILLITVSCGAMAILSTVILRKRITRPLKQLIYTMNRIKAGEVNVKLEEDVDRKFNIEEFSQVNRTFNEMMSQIQELRLKAYEEKLEKQQIMLGYLQLQIKPHFYLNCLKTLYALSAGRKYDKLQGMILEISGHLRYIFRNAAQLVTLDEELSFTQNYIKLMCSTASREIRYETDICDAARSKDVPPFIIQTFVENSVKYVAATGDCLVIKVRVIMLHDKNRSYLDIRISDNGSGYDKSVLDGLNGKASYGCSCHIGIENLKQRIGLLYGKEATMFFMNDNGAVSEVMLPVDTPVSGDIKRGDKIEGFNH